MKSLILYTSKHGSTKKIVDYMTSKLDADSFNLLDCAAPDIAEYEQIILGGSIYYGSVHSQMSNFVESHLGSLLNKRIALFLVCMLSEESAAEQFNSNFNEELLNHSLADGFFGGVITKDSLNPVEKLVTSFTFKRADTFDQIYFDEVDKFLDQLI